jgi:hypothetical protein
VHKANDGVCRAFAAAADPFVKQIDADKDRVTKAQSELESEFSLELRSALSALLICFCDIRLQPNWRMLRSASRPSPVPVLPRPRPWMRFRFAVDVISCYHLIGASLSSCCSQALQAKIDQAGIKNNRHTSLTARDCDVQWKQYVAFLQTKRQMLADQIETKKLRGVS